MDGVETTAEAGISLYNTERSVRDVLADIDKYMMKERENLFDNPSD